MTATSPFACCSSTSPRVIWGCCAAKSSMLYWESVICPPDAGEGVIAVVCVVVAAAGFSAGVGAAAGPIVVATAIGVPPADGDVRLAGVV